MTLVYELAVPFESCVVLDGDKTSAPGATQTAGLRVVLF